MLRRHRRTSQNPFFRQPQTRHRVDTRRRRFGNNSQKISTIIRKEKERNKRAKGSDGSLPVNRGRALDASEHGRNRSAVHGKLQNTSGYMLNVLLTAWTDELQVPNSRTREILKGLLLRSGMLAVIIQI